MVCQSMVIATISAARCARRAVQAGKSITACINRQCSPYASYAMPYNHHRPMCHSESKHQPIFIIARLSPPMWPCASLTSAFCLVMPQAVDRRLEPRHCSRKSHVRCTLFSRPAAAWSHRVGQWRAQCMASVAWVG